MSYDPKRRRRAKDPFRAHQVKPGARPGTLHMTSRTGKRRYDPKWRERAKGVLGRVTGPLHRFIGGMLGDLGMKLLNRGTVRLGFEEHLIEFKNKWGNPYWLRGSDVVDVGLISAYEYLKGGRSKWAGVAGAIAGEALYKGLEYYGIGVIGTQEMHKGGDIPSTGWYYLEEGEKVIPKNANEIDLKKPISMEAMYS